MNRAKPFRLVRCSKDSSLVADEEHQLRVLQRAVFNKSIKHEIESMDDASTITKINRTILEKRVTFPRDQGHAATCCASITPTLMDSRSAEETTSDGPSAVVSEQPSRTPKHFRDDSWDGMPCEIQEMFTIKRARRIYDSDDEDEELPSHQQTMDGLSWLNQQRVFSF